VYFSSERHGAAAVEKAVAAADALNAQGASADAGKMGDPFLGGQSLPALTANQLEAQFGSGFVDAMAGCHPQVWCAPVSSGFGQHAVLVEEYLPARLPALEDPSVRARIDSDVRRQRDARRLEDGLRALRLKYGVVAP
jgi:parvulin-like peptidyl-prolyl isomerase